MLCSYGLHIVLISSVGRAEYQAKWGTLVAWHLGQCSLRSWKSPVRNCNINGEANHLISCCSSSLNQNLLLFTGKHLTSSLRTFQGGDVVGIEFLKFIGQCWLPPWSYASFFMHSFMIALGACGGNCFFWPGLCSFVPVSKWDCQVWVLEFAVLC